MSDSEHVFQNARRYYLGKRLKAVEDGEPNDGNVWRGKQEAEPGTDLPSSFPSLAALTACGYTTEEDLAGADATELQQIVGLNAQQATAVLAALAEL